MADERTFRAILIVIFVVVLPIAAYHRLRSQATGERLDRRREGLFILLTLRPIGVAALLGLVAYMADPKRMAWSSLPLPAGLRWLGVGLALAAGALITWTLHTLGRNLTDTVVTRAQHTLVTSGPYRWVRHPFYMSVALLGVGSALVAANSFVLVAVVAFLVLVAIRTRTEEEHLLARFGDDYRAYRLRTGRFLPRVGR